jgi:hypothetical protein
VIENLVDRKDRVDRISDHAPILIRGGIGSPFRLLKNGDVHLNDSVKKSKTE